MLTRTLQPGNVRARTGSTLGEASEEPKSSKNVGYKVVKVSFRSRKITKLGSHAATTTRLAGDGSSSNASFLWMIGVPAMTTIAKLLAQKQLLLEQLNEGAGPHEREEIERLLMEIEDALNLVEEAGPGDKESE